MFQVKLEVVMDKDALAKPAVSRRGSRGYRYIHLALSFSCCISKRPVLIRTEDLLRKARCWIYQHDKCDLAFSRQNLLFSSRSVLLYLRCSRIKAEEQHLHFGIMSAERLFQPLQLGHCELKHRMVMAPLTRFRGTMDHTPGQHAKEYYEQRASVPGTLIITEATFISPQAGGYNHVPGIWNDKQIQAWKEIVDAVHAKGSFIWLQLWALGRAAGTEAAAGNLQREGPFPVVSSSAVPINSEYEEPKALTEEEIQGFVRDYANGARNAVKAGFDGVEIHGKRQWSC